MGGGGAHGVEHRLGTGVQHRADRADVQHLGRGEQLRQLVGDGVEIPVQGEVVLRGAVLGEGGFGDRSGALVGGHGDLHAGALQVLAHQLPVLVLAVAADEAHGVAQPGQADGDVQGAAAGQRARGVVMGADHVHEGFSDDRQHAPTLPRGPAWVNQATTGSSPKRTARGITGHQVLPRGF